MDTTPNALVTATPNLDQIRRTRGLSIRATAAAAGLPPSTVAHLFAAATGTNPRPRRKNVGYQRAKAVAAALGVPMGEVFTHPNGDPIHE